MMIDELNVVTVTVFLALDEVKLGRVLGIRTSNRYFVFGLVVL